MFKYIKHSLFHLMGLQATLCILLGGQFITFGLLVTFVVFIIGDVVLGDDRSTPHYHHETILTWQLWMALPLLCLIVFAAVWQFATHDLFNFGQSVTQMTDWDIVTNRGNASSIEFVACLFLTGFYIGMIGTVTAHELIHRTNDTISLTIGRWLLAFSFDTSFSVEHVYGHHKNVSTTKDPATAPRGRNVYSHIIISTYLGNISAWKIERRRLMKKHLGVYSYHNRIIRGYLMTLIVFGSIYYISGLTALVLLVGAGLWGKSLLEIVNYMEHYGIVRDPNKPVQPRHSWNTNKKISSWAMFNLTRHSHHHAKASVPFHQLKPMEKSPEMLSGYLGTVVIALIPPLWHKLMTPKILHWDAKFASDDENQLIQQANIRSGMKAFH